MIRRDKGSGEGFRTVSRSDSQESKLEAKKRRVQESSIRPEVRRVEDLSKVQKERLKGSYVPNDEDEKPTGYLDEDNEEVELSPDETPTGFLDTEEKELPKLKVTRVTGRGADVRRESIESSDVEKPNSGVVNTPGKVRNFEQGPKREAQNRELPQRGQQQRVPQNRITQNRTPQNTVTQDRGQREVPQNRPQNRPQRKRVENYPSGKDERFGFSDDNRDKRDVNGRYTERDNFDYNPPVAEKEPEKVEGRRRGRGGIVVFLLMIFIVMIITVATVFVVKFVKGTNTGVGLETVSGDVYSDLVNEVNALYTDANKCDILDSVTDSDIQEVVGLLGQYKDSSYYVESNYDLISQEIGTISFYLQDRDIYNDLVNGIYEINSKEYSDNFSTIENDIYLYTITGLAGTMRTKLEILKTTNGVVSQNSQESVDVASGNSEAVEEGAIVILESEQVVESGVIDESVDEYMEKTSGDGVEGNLENSEETVSSEEVNQGTDGTGVEGSVPESTSTGDTAMREEGTGSELGLSLATGVIDVLLNE